MNEKERCIEFLKRNGYYYSPENSSGEDYVSMQSQANFLLSIDIDNDEIVFVSDKGDFLHIPCNYYALIGALISFRQIAIDYIPVGRMG